MNRFLTLISLCVGLTLVSPSVEAKKNKSGKTRTTTSATQRKTSKRIMSILGYKPDMYLLEDGKVTWRGRDCGTWETVPGAILVETCLWDGNRNHEPIDISGFIIGDIFYAAFIGSEGYEIIEYNPESQTIVCGYEDDDLDPVKLSDFNSTNTSKVIRY